MKDPDRFAFKDFEFFANSPNRVFVLDALRGQSLSREALADEFSISRVTVKRILDDLEERGWIEPSESGYRATPLGEVVVRNVLTLHSKMASLRKIQRLEQWFPTGAEELDIRDFSDAEVRFPDRTSPLEPVDELCEIIAEGTAIRAIISCPLGFTHLLSNWGTLFENCAADTVDLLLTRDVLDAVSSTQEHVELMTKLAEIEEFQIRVHDEERSYSLVVVDSTVGLCLDDDQGFPRGTLVTDDESVRSWAETTFVAAWTDGRPFVEAI